VSTEEEVEEFVTLVQGAIQARGERPIPRRFIRDALETIERDEVEVERYPTGAPSLRAVATVAAALQAEATTNHRAYSKEGQS
jgi:hypothetical protein